MNMFYVQYLNPQIKNIIYTHVVICIQIIVDIFNSATHCAINKWPACPGSEKLRFRS